MSPANPFGVTS
jgi:hypothetical protein